MDVKYKQYISIYLIRYANVRSRKKENHSFMKFKNWLTAKNTKKTEDLYIRVLMWAYEKQETGFTWEEMKKHFDLNNLQENWVRKIFLTASDQDRKFLEHLRNDDTVSPNQHYYSLNEKGINTAINYKALTSAEKNSNTALTIAIIGIFLTAIGMFLQLKQTKLAEIQSIPEQINQARNINTAKDFCKQNPDAKESGLFEVTTGKPASCNQVILYTQQ